MTNATRQVWHTEKQLFDSNSAPKTTNWQQYYWTLDGNLGTKGYNVYIYYYQYDISHLHSEISPDDSIMLTTGTGNGTNIVGNNAILSGSLPSSRYADEYSVFSLSGNSNKTWSTELGNRGEWDNIMSVNPVYMVRYYHDWENDYAEFTYTPTRMTIKRLAGWVTE